MHNHLTISDVRFYIMDRASTDNPYLMDLAFTDDEIKGAMRCAAREYNSIPPLGVGNVNPDCLPADTNLFLDGTVAALLRMELLRRGRNDVEYQMEGASAQTEGVRLRHIQEEHKLMQERFLVAANNLKLTINTYSYFGPIT